MNIIRRLSLAALLALSLSPAFGQIPPPVPALPDSERRTSYSITASVCSCNVNFALFGDGTDYANWIEVFVNGVLKAQPGNWTLSSVTGTIGSIPLPITNAVLTFTAPQTGTIQIVGARRPRRTSQFNESTGVPTRNFNVVLSDLTAQNREVWDKINDVTGRSVRTPPGETLALLPVLASRASMGACFDSSGNLTSCVAAGAGSFAAGNGVLFTGVNPTTITNNIAAGNGVAITGSNLLTITNNIQAGANIAITGTNPLTIACSSCGGNVTGSGTPAVGDLAAFSNTGATGIAGTGYNAKQVPGLIPTTATVTISNASPGVVTWAGHGLSANDPVYFCTTSALPTGLTACVPATCVQCSPNTYTSNPTLYYVVGSSITTNTFTVATTIANAKAGTAVNTSSAGSGTHTAFANAMACAGCIGEFIYKNVDIAVGVAATSGAESTWNSITLSAGIWEVGGEYGIFGNTGTPVFSDWHATIGYSVSGGFLTVTSPFGGINAFHVTTNASNGIVSTFGTQQIFLTGSQAISSAAKVNWTGGGTALHYGGLWARRVK